jgi:hypothetical protein
VDVRHQAGEIGLAYGGRDQRIDNVFHQRIHNAGESGANDNCNSQIDHIAAQNKITKAFKHYEAPLYKMDPTSSGGFLIDVRRAAELPASYHCAGEMSEKNEAQVL